MTTITPDDPAYPLFQRLTNRQSLSVTEISELIGELSVILKNTNTEQRPRILATQQFIAEYLKVSKSLISQYVSIHQIPSTKIKDIIKTLNLNVMNSYYLSKIKEPSIAETEIKQLEYIKSLHPISIVQKSKLDFIVKSVQAISKNSGMVPQNFNLNSPTILMDLQKEITGLIANLEIINSEEYKRTKIQLDYANILVQKDSFPVYFTPVTSITTILELLNNKFNKFQNQIQENQKYIQQLKVLIKEIQTCQFV